MTGFTALQRHDLWNLDHPATKRIQRYGNIVCQYGLWYRSLSSLPQHLVRLSDQSLRIGHVGGA